jgi:hypothetical protein
MRARFQMLPLCVVAALVVLLVACGGSSSPKPAPANRGQTTAVTQQPTATTSAKQGKAKPCDLLTIDEIQSATGMTVAAGELVDAAECLWAVGPADEGRTIDVELFTADFYQGLAPSTSVKVSGIGDEAVWAAGLQTLYVKIGARAFAVQAALTGDDASRQAIAQGFARKVLERI